jgi:hypothetical protein
MAKLTSLRGECVSGSSPCINRLAYSAMARSVASEASQKGIRSSSQRAGWLNPAVMRYTTACDQKVVVDSDLVSEYA